MVDVVSPVAVLGSEEVWSSAGLTSRPRLWAEFRGHSAAGILADLPAVEQEVCWRFGECLSWTEAAVTVGLPPERGRAIQAKVQRRAARAVSQERARAGARTVTV